MYITSNIGCVHLRNLDFTSKKSVLLRNPNPDFMDFLFTVRLGNPKKDLQHYSRADYACACKTTILRDRFSIPFSDFPIAGKKGNPKTDISALKSTFRFHV